MDEPNPVPEAPAAAPTAAPVGSPLRRIPRAISSPWVSLALLTVAFLHQAIGSAFFPLRQAFEVNEMEWFNGPASALLWGAICVCLICASIVRVPWTLRKIGTHITHLGVVLLVISCAIYFGYKHEGDALLVRSYVTAVGTDGGACRLLPNPGYSAPFGIGTATVQSIMPRWTILSPEGKSQQAWAIMVEIELPDAPKFTATLIEDRPDLTQYTLAGRRPTTYLTEYPAVVAADGKLHTVTAEGKDVLATELKKGAKSVETVAGGERSLEVTNVTADFPLLADGFQGKSGTMVEWTLKTPGGQQSGSAVVGEPTLTRFQRARLKNSPDARLKTITLDPAPWSLAYHKDRPALWVRREGAALEADPMRPMRAMDDKSVTALAIRNLPRYHDYGADLPGGKPLSLPIGNVDNVAFAVTAFAPYARLSTRWKDVAEAPLDPRLHLRITSGADGKSFTRLIPPSSKDALESQPMSWVHCADQTAYDALRADLAARYPVSATPPSDEEAARTRFVLVTSPAIKDRTVVLLVAAPGTGVHDHPLANGSPVSFDLFGSIVTVELVAILQRPRQVTEPEIVPLDQRQSRMSVGDYESLIQVTATGNNGTASVWVPYTPFPNLPRSLGNDGALGMYAPRPVMIDIPGAGRFELCYSKEPLPMPGPIWMTGFEVPRRPGSNSPSEFFCQVGYGEKDAPQSATIHMNHPLAWQDTFFFQASWDPQTQALTVLGVGNRPAGTAMLVSALVLALGMAISGALAALPARKA